MTARAPFVSPFCSRIRAKSKTQARQRSYITVQRLTTLWQEKEKNELDAGRESPQTDHPPPTAMQTEKAYTNTICNDLAQSDHNDANRIIRQTEGKNGCGLRTSKQPFFHADGWGTILGCTRVQCMQPNQPQCQPKIVLRSGGSL